MSTVLSQWHQVKKGKEEKDREKKNMKKRGMRKGERGGRWKKE